MGDMVAACVPYFKHIYTIEIDELLYKNAVLRFKGYNNITLVHGDSAEQLKRILEKMDDFVVFWLDGHYSGIGTGRGKCDCPIIDEFEAITSRLSHAIILIDDARLFNGENSYPTIQSLRDFFERKSLSYKMKIKSDIIRLIY